MDLGNYDIENPAFDLIREYQDFIVSVWVGSGKYASDDLRNLYIASTGLAGETGEVLEKLKKHVRDGVLDREALLKELGDTLYYLVMIGRMFGYGLDDVIEANMEKLKDRAKRGVVHGSGDDR